MEVDSLDSLDSLDNYQQLFCEPRAFTSVCIHNNHPAPNNLDSQESKSFI